MNTIDIIVPTYGCHHYTKDFINTVYCNQWELNNVRIILIENKLDEAFDFSIDCLNKPIIIRNQHEKSHTESYNQGLSVAIESKTPYIVFSHNDILLPNNCLEFLTKIVDKYKCFVSPIAPHGSDNSVLQRYNQMTNRNIDNIYDAPTLTPQFCMTSIENWRKLEGFDNGFKLHMADCDLFIRCRKVGIRILNSNDINAHHYGGGTIRSRYPVYNDIFDDNAHWKHKYGRDWTLNWNNEAYEWPK